MSQDVNQDWTNRDFVESVEVAMRKCVDFLSDFHEQAKYRLSEVDQRLTSLERKVDFVEAQLKNADPSKRNAQPKSFKGSTFDPQVRREQVKKFRERLQKTEKVFSDRIIAPRKDDTSRGKLIVGGAKKAAQTEILGAPKSQGKGNIPIAQAQQQMKQQKELQKAQSKEQEMKMNNNNNNNNNKANNNNGNQPPSKANANPNRPPPSAAQAQKAMAAAGGPGGGPGGRPGGPPGGPGGPGGANRPPPSAAEAQKAMAKQQPPAQPQPQPPAPGPPPDQPGPPPGQPGPPMVPPVPQPPAQPPAQPQPPVPQPPPPGPGANEGGGEGEGTYPTDGGPGAPGFPHGDPGSIDLLIVTPGSGNVPGPKSQVEIQYTGFLADGSKFIEHQEVISLGLKQNIKGLEAGVQRMQEGTEAKLWIPSKLAYGVRGAPPLIPGNSDLTFEIKLLRIVQP